MQNDWDAKPTDDWDSSDANQTPSPLASVGNGVLSVICLAVVVAAFYPRNSEPSSPPFNHIKAEVYCKSAIKAQLREPDSFRFEKATVTSASGSDGTALISFRARNGFGGYNAGVATCSVTGDEATAQLIKS